MRVFFYLQRVLEAVTGMGISQVLRRLVFDPLAMHSTSFIWSPDWLPRTALPHDRNGNLRKNWNRPARLLHEAAEKRNSPISNWRYGEYAAVVQELAGTSLPNMILPNAASSMVTSANDYA